MRNKSSTCLCPACGESLVITTYRAHISGNWQRSKKNTFQSVATFGNLPATDGHIDSWEKRVPVGRLAPEDVKTSLLHGAVVGGFVTIGSFGIISAAYLSSIDEIYYLCWVPVAGFAFAGFTYLGGMNLARSLTEQVESLFGKDDEPKAEPPKPEPPQLEITHRNDKGKVIKRSRPTLPEGVSLEMVEVWCQQVGDGIKGLSEAEWAGADKPFTKTRYRKFIKLLINEGVIYKTGTARNSPLALTSTGPRTLPRWAASLKTAYHSRQTDGQTDDYQHIEV